MMLKSDYSRIEIAHTNHTYYTNTPLKSDYSRIEICGKNKP